MIDRNLSVGHRVRVTWEDEGWQIWGRSSPWYGALLTVASEENGFFRCLRIPGERWPGNADGFVIFHETNLEAIPHD